MQGTQFSLTQGFCFTIIISHFVLLAWAVMGGCTFHFVCGGIVISRDQVSVQYIACSTGLEKGNVHNTLCATVVHCAHVKLLCVLIYQ